MSWRPDRIASLLATAGMLLALAPAAHAAADDEACTATIGALPAVLSAPGTYCFAADLVTAMASGAAITVQSDDVVIDCNDFRLRGTAGVGTSTTGITGTHRSRVTVRRCRIRGFAFGIDFSGVGGGLLIEDNLLEGNTQRGMFVTGDGGMVRRNRVVDTGGSTLGGNISAYGMSLIGDVDALDNVVDGVAPTQDGGNAYGIATSASDATIARNAVRGLVVVGSGSVNGIYNSVSSRVVVRDNRVDGDGGLDPSSLGIYCASAAGVVRGNVVSGFDIPNTSCSDGGGNVIAP
jgi:hypothetical protein